MNRLLGLALALLLGACASTPRAPQEITPRPARESLQNFALNGRVAIGQGSRSSTVRIAWEHAGENDSIGIASPLGNVLAELTRTRQGARWQTADGEIQEARSADRLFARLTDAPIPLDLLLLWITGRTGPQAEALIRDPQGRLVSALDQGWVVHITAYESEEPNALPRTLEVEQPGLRLKLAIEEWLL
jgi:outer membrane lipoprotein LolB